MNVRLFGIHQALRVYKFAGQHLYNKPLLARKAFEKLADALPQKDADCAYQEIKIDGFDAEWVVPKDCYRDRVLLFFHGGGYATGSVHTHRPLVTQLAKNAGIKALSVDYHLAPEYQFPSQINECVRAYQFLLENNYRPENIAFAGESAGGGLVVGSLLYLKDNGIALPACALLLSPWLDLTASGESHRINSFKDPMIPTKGIHFWAENYAPGNLTNPYASPLHGNPKGLCPMYIQVGDCEILQDDSVAFANKAKKAKVEVKLEIWKNMFHAWQGFWMILPEGRAANKKLGKYLKEHLRIVNPEQVVTHSSL